MRKPDSTTRADESGRWGPDLLYSGVLLLGGVVAVAAAAANTGLLTSDHGWATAAFFLAFGLFTITTGFPHPVFGHVSFDRIAQVASILVLGPVDAAWVNGLASFIYPWHRLRQGVPLRLVVMAAMHNAGLMIFVILVPGLLYTQFGGPVPLDAIDLGAGILLLALVIGMQLVNDLGMMFMLYLRGSDPRLVFSRFTATVEYVSAAAGIVLAVAFTTGSVSYFVLLLLVLVAGMLVIMQYAKMRYRLERMVEERTEELRVQAKMFERQATRDKLTRLPNRRYADTYLEQQIKLALRSGRKDAVAFADVDHFKRINDGYSHAIGDSVLQRVARIFSEGCRNTDFVARYGGEEFLLYFPDTEADHALQVCEQLRREVEAVDWSGVAAGLGVTVSFGVAETGDSTQFVTLLNEADECLYRAKREGRNRVVGAGLQATADLV